MKKAKLFKVGVKALQSISDLEENIYVCPICLRGFPFEAIKNRDLTLEHAPQSSIGGEEILLTCHKCNSEAGYKFEEELNKRERLQTFLKALAGKKTFEGRLVLNMGGVSTNTNVTIKNGNVRFNIPKLINDPEKRDKLYDHLETLTEGERWSNEKFNIKPVISYHKHKAKVADLKSAYLLAFSALGYRYILRKELNIVRNQILNPDKKLLTNIFLDVSNELPVDRKIIAIDQPFYAILVQIDDRVIFLPPVENVEKPFKTISNFISNKNNFQTVSGKELAWPNTMNLLLDKLNSNE